MPINLNENEFAKVLADIETDLESVLKNEQDELRKDFPPKEDSDPAPEASAGGEGSESAVPESSESAAPEGSESAAPESSESAPPDASADPAAGGDPNAGGEDLETKLMALPEEQLRHLYMAAKQALFARMSQAGAPGAGGPPGAPPPGPAVGAPPDASASPAPMAPPAGPPMPPPAMKSDAGLGLMKPKAKGEMSSNKANGGPGPGAVKLGKNEEDMKNEDKETIADLKQQVELMAKAMNLAFGQPIRKAVVGISAVAKPGSDASAEKPKLSKTEITQKLRDLDQAKLTKHDRTAINQYYDKYDVEKIAHLLK